MERFSANEILHINLQHRLLSLERKGIGTGSHVVAYLHQTDNAILFEWNMSRSQSRVLTAIGCANHKHTKQWNVVAMIRFTNAFAFMLLMDSNRGDFLRFI